MTGLHKRRSYTTVLPGNIRLGSVTIFPAQVGISNLPPVPSFDEFVSYARLIPGSCSITWEHDIWLLWRLSVPTFLPQEAPCGGEIAPHLNGGRTGKGIA